MRSITAQMALSYFNKIGIIDTTKIDSLADGQILETKIPTVDKLNAFSSATANAFRGSEWVMLLIDNHSIFPSSQDLHLIYSFIELSGNNELIDDRPGFIFINYQLHELATMITICSINAFDVAIISSHDYTRVKVNHHGDIKIISVDGEAINSIKKSIEL